jgi:iron complex transport system substrate-binding protein
MFTTIPGDANQMITTLHKTILAMMLLCMGLLGCNTAPEAEPLAVLQESDTTRTIQHTFGTTEVPKNPQRVLTLGEEGLLADLLDAGITPVASSVNIPEDVPLIEDAEVATVQLFSSSSNVSVETLLTYDPDLIIGTVFFIDQIGYDRLTEIAPTVAVDGSNAFTVYTETMTVLGRREEAEQNVAAFREQVKAEGTRINAASRTVTVATIYPGPSVALWFDDAVQPGAGLLAEMGATIVPAGADREGVDSNNGRC